MDIRKTRTADSMDYIKRKGVKASQSLDQAAKGPPCRVAAWKGMGPSGYHKPPSVVAGYFGFIFLVVVLLMSETSGRLVSGQAVCELDRCSEKYMAVQDDNNTCAALRTYYQCIIQAKGCKADPITFHTMRQIVRNKLNEHNCTTTGQTLEVEVPQVPRRPELPAVCTFKGRPVYRYCGLFGDPHLRTFNDEVQTCKVKGARPLVNNDYLTVQVTNDLVLGSMDATAISKLTVIVKGHPDCTSKDFQTYQAQTGELPSTFDDGRVTVGPYRSLEVEELEPGGHVRIHLRYIHTEINIRQIGGYFTFSIKMPEDLINRTSGSSIPGSRTAARHAMDSGLSPDLDLCVRGCPVSEQIDYGSYLARYKSSSRAQADQGESGMGDEPMVSRDDAESLCREAELVDFYFDSCVFDLMTTGDENFTVSAKKALQDMVRLNPSVVRTMVNRTSLNVYDQHYNEPPDKDGHNAAVSFSPSLGWRTPAERHALRVLVLCLVLLFSVCRWSVR